MGCQGTCVGLIGVCFDKYGRFVARHPWWFILVPIVVSAALGVGLMKLSSEDDLETLYVPINSQSAQDRAVMDKVFPDKSDANFYLHNLARLNMNGGLIIKAKDDGDLLRQDVVDEIHDIIAQIKSINTTFNDTTFDYSDICAIRNKECFITGEQLLTESFLTRYNAGQITYPNWRDLYGFEVHLPYIVNCSGENGILTSVKVMKVTFNLRQTQRDQSEKWERAFVEAMEDITTNLTELVYTTSTSLDTELTSNIQSDIGWFSLSFTFMITYVSFAASSNNMVANRGHLARAGVIGVLLAILAAFGSCATSIDFVNIVGVMPFLVLGVGVDTMFVVMSEWAEHYDEASVEDQMGATLEKCGGSISIASLTDIIAFLIGVTSQFISIRNFCAYTAVALFFSFLWDLTFFMGCLAVHGQRVRARRCCMTCLVVPDRFKKWKSPERREEDESLCEKFPQYLLKLSMSDTAVWIVKMVIILLFAGYLGASVWGIYNLRQGLVLNNLVNDQSYFRLYEDSNREYYKTVLPISLVFQDLDFVNERDVNAMYKVFDTFRNDPQITNDSLICWYEEYKRSMLFNDTTHDVFIRSLQDFMFFAPSLSNDVTFTADGSDILASRCHFITGDTPDSTDQGQLMLHVRQLASGSDLNVFPYSAPFIFFEQYVMVLPSTLQTMGIAVACMFVITILFMPHPIMVTLVTLNMFSILAGILGFLYYWDLSLSSITMIHLIMSVGFSVDFSVHVCHGFISSDSETRNQKARDAIRVAAAPILNGGVTSLLGICMLVGSESYIFRSFFKIMVLVITFGLAHSMLLLPVVLSLIGPKLGQADDRTTDFIKTVPPTIENGHSKPLSEEKNTYYLNHAYDN